MYNGKRYITINTDASLCQQSNVGAWACHIVFDGFRIRKAAVFKRCPGESTHAEVMAIGNALYYVLQCAKQVVIPDIIVINCDNKGVKSYIYNRVEAAKVLELLQAVKKAYKQPTISFRHVKGHSKGDTPRKYLNNWCDEQAGKLMREARNKKNTHEKL